VADVTESLNFYDLYGYLFPGVAFTLLLVFPFWCYRHGPPANFGLGSAFAATIAAYIAGQLLQTIAANALPPKIRDKHGKLRFPSEIVLDHDDETFIGEVRHEVAAQVQVVFGIDVNDLKKLTPNRRDAFFLCRDALVASKQATYVEQYQGMYSLMCGLSAALLLGAGYLAGWALAFAQARNSVFAERALLPIGIALALISAVAVHWRRFEQTPGFDRTRFEHAAAWYLLAGLLLALGAVGHFLGGVMKTTPQQGAGFAAAWAVAVLLYFRCRGAYEFFAKEYAKAVWRGFLASRKVAPPSASSH
jgi:hypothetical protein